MTPRVKLRGALGAAGLAVGLGGIALEVRAMVWGAVAALTVAFLLRFADRRDPAASRAP